MILLYNIFFPLLFLLYLPFYLVHIFKRGGLTVEYWQRFGFFDKATKAKLRQLRNPVWLHAVSVGEAVAATTFLNVWKRQDPSLQIVYSCGTSTGFALAKKKLPADAVCIYCPFDFWWAVWHALNLVKPSMLLIFEVEIWPNLLLQAHKRGIKLALVNGRLSDKSTKGYQRWRGFFGRLFRQFDALCLQSPEDAARLRSIIGDDPRIAVCDTMKFDQVPDRTSQDKSPVLDKFFGPDADRLVFTVGSTHEGEEETICTILANLKRDYPHLKTVRVPRHQERAAEVERVVIAHGLTCRCLQGGEGDEPVDVLLVNTTGELMDFYACCDLAFVGKSLDSQEGGHNMIEPAIFGKPVIYGPHIENFRAVGEFFREANASIELRNDAELEPTLRRLLDSSTERETLGQRARQLVEQRRGAIDRTISILKNLQGN